MGGVFSIQFSVEKCRLIILYLFENRAHERLADETTTVLDVVLIAETVQRPLLTFVEHDTDSMFAWCFQKYSPNLIPGVIKTRPEVFVYWSDSMISVVVIFACCSCVKNVTVTAVLGLIA